MIDSWVEDEYLVPWGRWTGDEKGIGYARENIIAKMMGRGTLSGGGHQLGHFPDKVARADKALAKMKVMDKTRYFVVYLRHVHGKTDEEIASQIRISKDELDAIFTRAFFYLESHLAP